MNSVRFACVFLSAWVLRHSSVCPHLPLMRRELAIKLQLGEVVQSDYEPGLHFKMPIAQNIRKFPKRILTISDRPERIFTAENEALRSTSSSSVESSIRCAFTRRPVVSLVDRKRSTVEIIKNAIVTEFGKRTVHEAISVERAELMRDMLATRGADSRGPRR